MCQQQIYPSNAIDMPVIPIHVHMTIIWTECNQQCEKELWYTKCHITYICPWTNMSTTLYMYLPLNFYCSLHRPHNNTNIHQTSINGAFICLPYYCTICANNKCALQITQSLHTDDKEDNNDDDDDDDDGGGGDDDEITGWLHLLSWPFGQISQKVLCTFGKHHCHKLA